ncbi:alpha/beta hydrolase family protein [Shinella sp. G-2]|uniref:alpha/beta hydrolase family protein n=1 Tax=Shinella sp. G-2 TaxID=3133141 RepID=UPI003D07382D
MFKPLFTAAVLLAGFTMPAHADAVGVRDVAIAGSGDGRALSAVVWYPTADNGTPEIVGENPAFVGLPALRGASPGDGAHPLVVLSHGYGGSWRNLSWLANALAAQGYVVAATDHPGTTTFDRSPVEAAKLWERPRDLIRLIDALFADRDLGARIDHKRVAAIGHSLGGWTVAALAGARVDTARFAEDCKEKHSPRACALSHELGLDSVGEARTRLEGDLADPRIGAVVSLDLGLARGFSPESLTAVHTPMLIFAAGIDVGGLPGDLESGYLAAGLPMAMRDYVVIPDAMHFSFMQMCKPGAVEMIETRSPGDGVVCKDGGTRGRAAIHAEVVDRVATFLGATLP